MKKRLSLSRLRKAYANNLEYAYLSPTSGSSIISFTYRPIGDSNTADSTVSFLGHRYHLKNLYGDEIDMVGNQADGAFADNQHDGYPGYNTAEILFQLNASASVPADIIGIQASINDTFDGLSHPVYNTLGLYHSMSLLYPSSKIIVATTLPVSGANSAYASNRYPVWNAVKQHAGLEIVDLYTILTGNLNTHMADTLHANYSGTILIANEYKRVIDKVRSGTYVPPVFPPVTASVLSTITSSNCLIWLNNVNPFSFRLDSNLSSSVWMNSIPAFPFLSGGQTNVANYPSFAGNLVNGYPALFFSGTSVNATVFNLPPLTQSMNHLLGSEIITYCKAAADPPDTNRSLYEFGAASTNTTILQTGATRHWNGTTFGRLATTKNLNLNVWRIVDEITKPIPATPLTGSLIPYIDGVAQLPTGSSVMGFSSTPKIGRQLSNGCFGGHIAEMFLFDRPLSVTDRNTVYQYLINKYNSGSWITVPTD